MAEVGKNEGSDAGTVTIVAIPAVSVCE